MAVKSLVVVVVLGATIMVGGGFLPSVVATAAEHGLSAEHGFGE